MPPKTKKGAKAAGKSSSQPSAEEQQHTPEPVAEVAAPSTTEAGAGSPGSSRKKQRSSTTVAAAAAASPKQQQDVPSASPPKKAAAATDASTSRAEAKKAAPSVGVATVDAPTLPLHVTVADNVAPASIGIAASSLSQDETRFVTARSNGSLAMYRILKGTDHAKNIFNILMTANTGGSANASITAVTFLGSGDEYVAVAYGSGNVGLFDAVGLSAVAMLNRAGGVVRSVARYDATSFFAACADGGVRRYRLTFGGGDSNDDGIANNNAGSAAAVGLEVVQSIPKVSGCERALCVTVCHLLNLVIVGDDARTVTAWELDTAATTSSSSSSSSSRAPLRASQKWNVQLPTAYPLVLAADGQTIAVGTSLNQVVFIDPSHGVIVNTFEHHRGPVTVLTASQGVFYASGWHESLRAYRPASGMSRMQQKRLRRLAEAGEALPLKFASDYAPAEVKRRTHYHECTSVAVGPRTGLFLSTARDGTIMYANLGKLFTHPATYVDSKVSTSAYTVVGGDLLVTHRGAAVEIYRLMRHAIAPFAQLALETSDDGENIRGVWLDRRATRLCVATDSRVAVFSLAVDRDANRCTMQRLANAPLPCVNAACFVSDDLCWVGSGNVIFSIAIDAATTKKAFAAAKHIATRTKRAAEASSKADTVREAAVATSIVGAWSHVGMQGIISSLQAARPGDAATATSVFVATQSPNGILWVQPDAAKDRPLPLNATFHARLDVASVGPLMGDDDRVVYLDGADGRHYATQSSGKRRPFPIVSEDRTMPQNATVFARPTPEGHKNESHLAYFPNALIDMRASAEKWNFTRPADRAKARPNDVKPRTEFAAFVPGQMGAAWTTVAAGAAASSSSATAADPSTTSGAAAAERPAKSHRSEPATLAFVDGQLQSDQDDSDLDRDDVEGAEAKGTDSVFVLRRNIGGLLQELPLMWRVRRFGN